MNIKSVTKNVQPKQLVYDSACDVYNKSLADYKLQYKKFSDGKNNKRFKHNFIYLFLDG